MQALTNIAAQLLRKNSSIVEDLFRDAAATVHHFEKRSHLQLHELQSKTSLHALRSPKTPRVRHFRATSPSPWQTTTLCTST